MGKKIARPAAPDLEALRQRFAHWRQSGRKGRRIPDKLWRDAAKLTRIHSISRVAQGLGLDYNGLKRRVEKELPNAQSPNFVEFAVDTVARKPECVMEYQGRHGKLTIRLTDPDASEVVSLAKALTLS